MGGRRHGGTRTGAGWFGSEPKAPLALETGMAARLSPLPPLLPQPTRAPSPLPPPRLHLLLGAPRTAHTGRAPGRLSWLCRQQPEPWKKDAQAPANGCITMGP